MRRCAFVLIAACSGTADKPPPKKPNNELVVGDFARKPPVAFNNSAAALQLLQANCACHNGSGRGPDISHEGSKRTSDWIAAYIAKLSELLQK